MYETFFEFHSRPFASAPQTRTYFPATLIENARQTLTRLIERAKRKGNLRDSLDPEVAAWAFIGSNHTMYLIDKFDERADLDEAYVDRLINTILGL